MLFSSDDEVEEKDQDMTLKRKRFYGSASYFNQSSQQAQDRRAKLNAIQKDRKGKMVETFAQLDLPSDREAWKIIDSLSNRFETLSKEAIMKEVKRFPLWWWELQNGFNLLFYGFGSKKQLLELLAEAIKHFEQLSKMQPSCVLVVNAYSPTFNMKTMLSHVLVEYLGMPEDQLRKLASSLDGMSKLVVDVCADIAAVKSGAQKVCSFDISTTAPAW